MTTTTATTPTSADSIPAGHDCRITRCDPHTHPGEHLPRWQHGHVAWFDTEKGFGFLTPENGPAVFVDHRVIQVAGYKFLDPGQPVVFTATDTTRGPEASRVVPYLRTNTSTPSPHRHGRAHAPTGQKQPCRFRYRQNS